MSKFIKKILSFTLLIIIFSIKSFAPSSNSLVIINNPAIEPFKDLIYAIGKVETNLDTLAFNPVEEAVGYFQIRPIRLKDYNERTGNNYTKQDLFNYKISENIFLYYASVIGPYNLEKIARNWNGSGPQTIYYWKQVKKYL